MAGARDSMLTLWNNGGS